MMLSQVLLLVILLVIENTLGASKCNSNQPVRRVYPLRRRISFPATTGCSLAHSGLLLEMTDGKACVLEYSTDGNARLYGVNPVYYSFPCWWKKCYIISPTYSGTGNYMWSRDSTGYHVKHHSITPKAARDTMQGTMGYKYHLTKRNSHQALSALKKMWKIPSEDPNLDTYPSPSSICSCIPRTLNAFVPHDMQTTFQMAKQACKK